MCLKYIIIFWKIYLQRPAHYTVIFLFACLFVYCSSPSRVWTHKSVFPFFTNTRMAMHYPNAYYTCLHWFPPSEKKRRHWMIRLQTSKQHAAECRRRLATEVLYNVFSLFSSAVKIPHKAAWARCSLKYNVISEGARQAKLVPSHHAVHSLETRSGRWGGAGNWCP